MEDRVMRELSYEKKMLVEDADHHVTSMVIHILSEWENLGKPQKVKLGTFAELRKKLQEDGTEWSYEEIKKAIEGARDVRRGDMLIFTEYTVYGPRPGKTEYDIDWIEIGVNAEILK